MTAEFAILLPALMILSVPALSAVGWQAQQLKLWNAAGVVVRAASHSEPNPEKLAGQLVAGATGEVKFDENIVCATVQVRSPIAFMPHPIAKLCTRVGGL